MFVPRRSVDPPAIRTFPSKKRVAVCAYRAATGWPEVATHVPVTGLYSSALARTLVSVRPHVTSTVPSGKSVAVWKARRAAIAFVNVDVTTGGLYSSTLARAGLKFV